MRNKEVDLRSNFALYFRDYNATNISESPRCHKYLVFSYIWRDYLFRALKINKCLEIREKQEFSFIAGGDVKWYSHFGRQFGNFSQS